MKTIVRRKPRPKIRLSSAAVLGTILGAIFLVALAQPALAGDPEYLQLKLQVGQALEIEGNWDSKGIFVATDIEKLPQARRPKLRGSVMQVNSSGKTISMYGLTLKVDDQTEFIESGDKFTFDSLKAGLRVEVSCKIDDDGSWLARKIKARGVKPSDKIKGTVSRVAVDGKIPDTIEISSPRSLDNVAASAKIPGILILLIQETDILGAVRFEEWIGEEEFGDLNNSSATDMTKGIALNDKFTVSGEFRNNVRSQRQFDLTNRYETDGDESQSDARVQVYGFFEKNMRAFGELRLRKTFFISSDLTNPDDGPYKGDVIQLYFLAPDIGGKKVALQIGRQDYDEPRQWLFDDYLDAIRISYYGQKPLVFEAAFIYGGKSYKPEFQAWRDLYGSIRYYFDRKSFASVYVLKRSSTEGDVDDPSNPDDRNREPIWWGLRYYGRAVNDLIHPWAEFAIIRGEDKFRTLEGSAFDLGVTAKAVNQLFQPSVTFGYAVGSGDSTNGSSDPIDHRFRQSGYEDNVDRLGGATSLSYYGAALDPELSNIKILTLGAGIQPTKKSSVEVLFHRYNQETAKGDDIQGANFQINDTTSVTLTGLSTDIGWALDMVVGFPKLWQHVKSRLTLGWFHPGEAFLTEYREVAFLTKIDIKVGF